MLEDEGASLADLSKLEELRQKIKTGQEIMDLDDQFPITFDDAADRESTPVRNFKGQLPNTLEFNASDDRICL